MEKVIITLSFIILFSWGDNCIYAQTSKVIFQEYRILERELRNDESGGMPYNELKNKYLKKFEQLKERSNALESQKIKMNDIDNNTEKQILIECQRGIENRIFKLTIAQELLNQPRNRIVADSLIAIYRISDRREAIRKSAELLNNYQIALVNEVYQHYHGESESTFRKAALDSVFLVMKAFRTIPQPTVKRKIRL